MIKRHARRLARRISKSGSAFPGSARYWEDRYATGGTSGAGSYGEHAAYKAQFLNQFVATHGVSSVIEFGCGDGNQLSLARYPRYLGIDVSPTSIATCITRFHDDDSKSFLLYADELFTDPAGFLRADLAISLDVIFHLVEDDVYDRYMRHLFRSADHYVVIYAIDDELADTHAHVRHRRFTTWVQKNMDWKLIQTARRREPQYQDFFVYAR